MYNTKRSAPVGSVLAAKFDGVCKACGKPYLAGTIIKKTGYKTWVHSPECPGSPSPSPSPSNNGYHADPVPEPVPSTQSIDPDSIRVIVRDELQGANLQVDEAEVKALAKSVAKDVVHSDMDSIIKRTRDDLLKAGIIKQVIEVKLPDGTVNEIEGKVHPSFNRILRLASLKPDAFGKLKRQNILLIGPAGCGKTHLAEQVAKALGLRFAHISCSAGMSEGQLTGRLLPTPPTPQQIIERVALYKAAGFSDEVSLDLAKTASGCFAYTISQFVDCYENGGVFLFDEIDAADSNTLLVLNAALANGYLALPNRPDNPVARRHQDFVCIAAANTHGTGADREYVGRNQLDEATLDRFRIGQIEMDYDLDLEAAMCPDDALRTRLQNYRNRMRTSKVRRVISSRFMQDAWMMKNAGDTDAEIDTALMAGWSADEKAKVRG